MYKVRFNLFKSLIIGLSLVLGLYGRSLLAQANAKLYISAKPSTNLALSFVPQAESSELGATTSATLSLVPGVDVSLFNISLTTTGNVVLNSANSLTLPGGRVGAPFEIPFQYTVNGSGEGEIHATVKAVNATGELVVGRRAIIYFLASDSEVLYSTSGLLDLQLRRLSISRSQGELTDVEYEASLEKTLGKGAAEIRNETKPEVGAAAVAANITVSGRILWTDSAGGTHPVRLASVEIRDEELIGSDLVTTVTTDRDGNYSATVDNDDGIGQAGRDIFIRVLAQAPGFSIKPPDLLASIHRIDSSAFHDVVDGTSLTLGLTANNSDDNNTAFSVLDALVTANDYIVRVNGIGFPEITVLFPKSASACDSSPVSCFDGTNLNILQLDRFDWDVIHHEYGHYVQSRLNIANSPGGTHGDENLGERIGKDNGIRLAWGEGWPTYFGTSLQQIEGTASLSIPNVGDTRYQDTEDFNPPLDNDLETQTGSNSLGEDNELSVQRILWDLYDAANDAGDTGIAFGHGAVWSKIDAANPTTLSAAYQALIAGKTIRETAQIGCILGEHKVAPNPTAPADKSVAPNTPPAFQWDANGGGPSNLNNKFIVEFYDALFQTLVFATPEQDATTFTPTQSQWDDILAQAGSIVNWVVKGRQVNTPVTGPYTSCGRRLIQAKLDLVFVIDTTGSMADDINAVKASATDIVNTIASSGTDFRIGLVDYKDHPIAPYGDPGDYPSRIDLNFSTDQAAIVAAINSLSVGGGADTPESVYSGLMQGIGFPWRNGVKKAIILMGDAPPHDPEPVTGFTLDSVSAAAFAVDPANIYPIFIGSDPSARTAFQQLAHATSGETFEAGSAAQVVTAILQAIETILRSPTADAGGPYSGAVGETIAFNGSSSFDPDGTITLYEWDFESDGTFDTSSSDPTATHTYPAAFSGMVTLRVTDNDGNIGTGTASVQIGDVTTSDLSLSKTATPNPVATGQNLTYDLTVTNNGTHNATGVTVVDNLPAAVTFISATPSQGSCSEAGGTVTCDLGNLANGTNATVAIVVTANAGPTITNVASVTANETDPDTSNNSASVETTVNPPPTSNLILISSNVNGSVPGLRYRDEDIIANDPASNAWSMIFDGSDVGLGNVDVDAFAFLPNGHLLLSVDKDFTLNNFGAVDDADILEFIPLELGNNTRGSYLLYFDGSDVGLADSGEDIDAIDFDQSGKLVISVNGSLNAPGVSGSLKGNDEDLLVLNNGVFGSTTSGTWALYFDGSDVGLTSSKEDLQALWIDHARSKLYFATLDDYSLPGGLKGNEDDIVICTYISLGDTTACTFERFWDGDKDHSFDEDAIDGLSIDAAPAVRAATANDLPGVIAVDDTVEALGDDADDPDELDGEEEMQNQFFLPLVRR